MTGIDVFCFILISLSSFSIVAGNCDLNGQGSAKCVLLEPYYNKYQWATCLTDIYIKTFSKGRHHCLGGFATCWYQCMMEVHNDLDHVYDDCACGSDAPANLTTQPTVVTPAIPDWCFSPSGDNCNWYRECLEKRFPCKQSGSSYALDFAEKFCNLYQKHYRQFDSIGQQWIDGVRKCLQVNLVPILRPFVTKTCSQIKQMAFDSHPGCYLRPSVDKPSVCDIGALNWWNVYWTIKSSFHDAPSETFKQAFVVASVCGIKLYIDGVKLMIITLKNIVVATKREINKVMDTISKTLDDAMNFDENGLLHILFPQQEFEFERKKRSTHNDGDESTVYINVLLADGSKFDLNAMNGKVINVTEAAINVAKAIEKGDVSFNLKDGIKLASFSVCININCTETYLKVTPAITSAGPSLTAVGIGVFAGVVSMFLFFL